MYLTLRDRPDTAVESPSPDGSRRSRILTGNVLALGVTSMLTDISSEMVVAVLPLYLTLSLGLSTVAFGFFEGAYQLVGALFRLVGGAAADRTQRHKRIAASGYALSAATRIGLIASTVLVLPIIPILLVERVGKGIRSAPRDALLSLSTATHRLGAAFGVHRTLDTLGATLGPFIAFLVLRWSADSYRSLFVVSLAFAVLGVMVILTFAEAPPQVAVPPEPSRQSVVAPLIAALREPAIRRVALVAALLGLVTISDGFVYLLIQRHTTLRIGLFPLLFAGTAVAYLVLAVPLGWLADQLGRRRVFVAGHVATLLLYCVLAWGARAGTFDARWAVLCLALLGIYYAATDGVLAAAVSGLSDAAQRSSAIAVVTVGAALGGLVSAVGFGLAWHQLGSAQALNIMLMLMLMALPLSWLLLRGADGAAAGGAR